MYVCAVCVIVVAVVCLFLLIGGCLPNPRPTKHTATQRSKRRASWAIPWAMGKTSPAQIESRGNRRKNKLITPTPGNVH